MQSLRQIQREYKAVCSLLIRSNLYKASHNIQIGLCRHISTSCAKLNDNDSSSSKNSPPNTNKDSKKNNEEKVKALMIRLAVWTMFSYMGLLWLLYLFSARETPDKNEVSFIY